MIYLRNAIKDPLFYKVNDRSMVPQFSLGDTLLCVKQNRPEYIRYGEAYLIKYTEGILLRKIYPGNNTNTVFLKCSNPLYLDIELTRNEIESLWLVKSRYTSNLVPIGKNYSHQPIILS